MWVGCCRAGPCRECSPLGDAMSTKRLVEPTNGSNVTQRLDRPRKKIGRPPKHSPKTEAQVLEYLAQARPLSWIERQPGMPSRTTILGWANEESSTFVSGFPARYARARESAADHLAAEALAIADDPTGDYIVRYNAKSGAETVVPDYENVHRSRLRVDTRKWAAAKFHPSKYGDRVATEVSGPRGGPIQTQGQLIIAEVTAGLDAIRAKMRATVSLDAGPPLTVVGTHTHK